MKKNILKLVFGWPLSLLALFFIIKFLLPNTNAMYQSFFHLNFGELVLGIFFLLIYFVLRALLWHRIIQSHGATVSYQHSTYYWALSELRRYIPGSVLAIASRVVHFSGEELNKKQAGLAYVQEAIYIVLGSLLVAILGLNFFIMNVLHFPNAMIWTTVGSVGIALSTIIVMIILTLPKQISNLFRKSTIAKQVETLNRQTSPSHAIWQNINLLSLSTLAFFFLGLGQFFVITSLFYLPLNSLYILAGFFSISYILGYLLFIAPSGLGVREWIVLTGLTPLLTAANAAFASLFSRVFLIVAELIFFAAVSIWYKIKLTSIRRLEQLIRSQSHVAVLTLFVIAYSLYFTITSFLRYDNFYTGRFDLGNMAQTVWNTEHGRIFLLTDPNGTYTVSRLATHADFLLIFLVPFYWIWADPRMLLLIQTIVLALGAYAVYLIAKKVVHHNTLALVFGIMYLLNPSIQRTNIYDFHAVTLATTFLLFAFYFILQKKLAWFLVFSLLAALTKEQVWFIIGLMSLYYGFKHKQLLLGGALCIIMTAMSYFLISVAIPQALGAQHFALSYYSDFGDTPGSVIKNILFSPNKIIQTVLQPGRIHYLQQIFSPFGYLSIFAPLFLLFTVPELIVSMLSNNPNLYQIYYQYTATITPFILIAAVYGIKTIVNFSTRLAWSKKHRLFLVRVLRSGIENHASISTFFAYYLIIITIATAYLYGPLPGAVEANTDMFTKQITDASFVDQFLSHIPRRYSVAASNNLGSHLSQRQNIYTTPLGVDKADIIALLLNDPNPPGSVESDKQLAQKLMSDPDYTIWYQDGPFVVFRKANLPNTLRI